MSAKDAAEAYCDRNFPSISWSYATRRQAEEAFRAGVEWALSPPTPEEIRDAGRAVNATKAPSGKWSDVFAEKIASAAILAFLEERKR
jgi:hypothetical protein